MQKVIDWFEIPVSDVPRAQAFYEAVLQTTLQVGACGTLVYLHAGESLDAALQRVQAAGGQVAMGKVALPEGLGFMAHMLDVDGNRVGLHAYA